MKHELILEGEDGLNFTFRCRKCGKKIYMFKLVVYNLVRGLQKINAKKEDCLY